MRPCEEIRPILRDYSDGELTPEEKSEVDEHVHGCETCGRRLLEAELEVIRLKQAIQFVEPPPDFTRIVVQRAREVLAEEEPERANLLESPDEGFTESVMQQVLREAMREGAEVTGKRRRGGALVRTWRVLRHPTVFMPLAAAAAVVVAWFLLVRPQETNGLRLEHGSAWTASAGSVVPVDPGRVLASGREIRVEEGAAALFSGSGSLAELRRIEIQGPARVALAEGASPRLSLSEGAVRISASKEVAVLTPLPAEVRLLPARSGREEPGAFAAGDLEVSLREITRHDEALAGSHVFQSLRLKVYSGEAALVRGESPPEVIRGREVAVLNPWSGLHREKALETEWLEQIGGDGGRDPEIRLAMHEKGVRGKVVHAGADAAPVAGATVTLHLGTSLRSAVTPDDGSFEFAAADSAWEGNGAFLSVTVPERSGASDLAYFGVREPPSATTSDIGWVPLARSRSARGHVFSADGTPVADARVRVFEYDEIFGRSRELTSLAVATDSAGMFRLVDLPSGHEPGTGLVLLLDHREYPLTPRFDLYEADRSAQGVELELFFAKGRTVALSLPPPETGVVALVVVDEPVGIAKSWCTRLRDFRLEAEGLAVPAWTASARVFEQRGNSLVARRVVDVPDREGQLELGPRGPEVLSGRVSSADSGQPVPSLPVLVGSPEEGLRAECVTDEKGEFRFEGVSGGSLFLELGTDSIARITLGPERRNLEVPWSASTAQSAPTLASLRYRASTRPPWRRHGHAGEGTGAQVRITVLDGSSTMVAGASLFFYVPGSDHATFLGRSHDGQRAIVSMLPRQGRLLAIHRSGGIAFVDLASLAEAGPGRTGDEVVLRLRQPVSVEGSFAQALGGASPPVVVRAHLAKDWEVSMARHRNPTGSFLMSFVPTGDPSGAMRVSCGEAAQDVPAAAGTAWKVNVSGAQDGSIELKATPID